jgi:uncharacterized protein YggE
MRTFYAICLTALLLAICTNAQETSTKLPSIETTGEAVITVKSDRAQLDIGVVTQASTSDAAALKNAVELETVLSQLRGVLGPNADIKTISYSLSPNYRYPTGGGEPTITGYTATNIVRAAIDDLTKVGKVIDATTGSGANRVQGLEFTLKNRDQAEAEALRAAALNARRKANTLAAALDVGVVRILSAVESSPTVTPVRSVAFARAEAAATPIESGTIEVRATVTLTVQIGVK